MASAASTLTAQDDILADSPRSDSDCQLGQRNLVIFRIYFPPNNLSGIAPVCWRTRHWW